MEVVMNKAWNKACNKARAFCFGMVLAGSVLPAWGGDLSFRSELGRSDLELGQRQEQGSSAMRALPNAVNSAQISSQLQAYIQQSGVNNQVQASQEGVNHILDIRQTGNGNAAIASQSGLQTSASIQQSGNDNRADLQLSVTGTNIVVRQQGDGGNARVVQY